MTAYYNEYDKYAAEWLCNLIAAGYIAPGVVDTRSIEDVHPADLKNFTQCHFFAGIGGWSIALRAAGWSDDRPIWTGSCPCQPFSAAGEGAGFADERHLWPAFHHLIRQRRPAGVLGEQVASKGADPWVDLVQADMEALGYAFGSVPFPSASVGAPHIRDRNYWVAHANGGAGGEGRAHVRGRPARGDAHQRTRPGGSIVLGGLADAARTGSQRQLGHQDQSEGRAEDGGAGRVADRHGDGRASAAIDGLHDAAYHVEPRIGALRLDDARRHHDAGEVSPTGAGQSQAHRSADIPGGSGISFGARPGPTNGFWRDADWIFCRDAKWRPVEAGTFPLADGLPAGMVQLRPGLRSMAELAGLDGASLRLAKSYRVGALRGYGNAINPEQAAEFIRIVMECQP